MFKMLNGKYNVLWHNSSICADAKPVYYKVWMERGILMVADITKDNGILYKYDELMNKYRLQIRFMDYACLIDAIPKVGKDFIKRTPFLKI